MSKQIKPLPEWLVCHVVGRDSFEFRGARYEYSVVSAQMGVRSGVGPVFTIYLPELEVLAVSDGVPTEYRLPYLIHEIVERDPASPLGCVEALEVELEWVKVDGNVELSAYLEARRDFFAAMVRYYEGKPKMEALLQGLRESHQFLVHVTS